MTLSFLAKFVHDIQQATGFAEWNNYHSSVFPLCEAFHFVGLSLLIGAVGIFDLRLLGVAKGLPIAALRRFLRWGVLGFAISLITGISFVLGNPFNDSAYMTNMAFFWKMVFISLAGINLLVFYVSGMSRKVDRLGPGEDAPLGAKVIGAVSLFLWIGVIFWGRFLPVLGDAF